MPYNPSTDIYSLPAIYLAIPGTVIIAAQHNDPLVDLQTANNYARPVIAGGTGANNPTLARTNLDAAGLPDQNDFEKLQAWSKGADIASASELVLGDDGNYFVVTGTTTITGITEYQAGTVVYLRFADTLVIEHDPAAIILPASTDIVTSAGDVASFVSDGAGVWRCLNYRPAQSSAPIITPWNGYTPAITGFGTPSSVLVQSRRVGASLEIQGRFTSGVSNTDLGAVQLGFNGLSGGLTISTFFGASRFMCGSAVTSLVDPSSYTVLGLGTEDNIKFGIQNATRTGVDAVQGNALLASGDFVYFFASVRIAGWG